MRKEAPRYNAHQMKGKERKMTKHMKVERKVTPLHHTKRSTNQQEAAARKKAEFEKRERARVERKRPLEEQQRKE